MTEALLTYKMTILFSYEMQIPRDILYKHMGLYFGNIFWITTSSVTWRVNDSNRGQVNP